MWFFSREDILNSTPSRQQGLSAEAETRLRREGARFIMDAGAKLGLTFETLATGVVFFHRFYMFRSFRTFPHRVVGAACLLLAGKVEETPKKCRDILRTVHGLMQDKDFGAFFGNDPKETLLVHERILLQTIKFDLQIQHPYSCLLKFAKALKGDRPKLQKVVQMAWNFVNDSLITTLCLQWEPPVVAIAVLHLAAKINSFELQVSDGQPGKPWWANFVPDVDVLIIEEVDRQVLESYEEGKRPRVAIGSLSTSSSGSCSPAATVSAIDASMLRGVHTQPLATALEPFNATQPKTPSASGTAPEPMMSSLALMRSHWPAGSAVSISNHSSSIQAAVVAATRSAVLPTPSVKRKSEAPPPPPAVVSEVVRQQPVEEVGTSAMKKQPLLGSAPAGFLVSHNYAPGTPGTPGLTGHSPAANGASGTTGQAQSVPLLSTPYLVQGQPSSVQGGGLLGHSPLGLSSTGAGFPMMNSTTGYALSTTFASNSTLNSPLAMQSSSTVQTQYSGWLK